MKNADAPIAATQEKLKPNMGLTKREHFAAVAMQGLLSNPLEVPSTGGKKLKNFIATCSIDFADALLEELEK